MTLDDEMTAAAAHLRNAVKLAADWRVREALAGAGTAVECGLYIQRKIAAGEVAAERDHRTTGQRDNET